ncbi:PqqD family protein [Arcticibacterium luteifluviistationis]|uniref:PqqD family protein n=1 Tax=Arcticibacterium luteifluviistationis TaxID=1784714 RepID=A0A2Z4GFB4_9BACT|nr:PqqD family protein [Arcticibacterium luteifluviistationis]AWV99996.1 hypothetical protein DJ013_18220 [Arcticibacterium luteifluviistationis]
MNKNYTIAKSGIAFEQFTDEFVVVNLPEGHYYSLRGTAFFMFQFLTKGSNASSISSALAKHFDISEQDALKESEQFIDALLAHKLLLETEEEVVFNIPSPEVKSPFLKPEIETFDDMKELLILDPVHDVDPQEGWPLKK